ncbi:DUF6597 domain-containing transcriptional factor [Compostibacter hankyongensis]|uniref:Helix-turn-helix domain-containing protein n=1 Tax=Compostibacter hankyongensis TaxID=1007089 RepID=A0ABP8G1T9_9BACT
MLYRTISPPPQLAPFVRAFWVLEGAASTEAPYIHRTLADGCAELIFHYRGRFDELTGKNEEQTASFRSGIHGPHSRFRRFIVRQDFGIFGVYLYPYALPLLFSRPANVLSNEMPSLEALSGNEGKILEEQVMPADHAERIAFITAFLEKKLLSRAAPEPPVFAAIRNIIRHRGTDKVKELANTYALSTRQFERNFKFFSGFSPKLYSRIIRFQSVQDAYKDPNSSLTRLAYASGYYDQSHFIHDFRTFSGYHPRHFFFKKTEATAFLENESR